MSTTYYPTAAAAQAAALPGQRVATVEEFFCSWAPLPAAKPSAIYQAKIPAGNLVHDGPSLAAQLATGSVAPIVLEPGVYDLAEAFRNSQCAPIYSAQLGKAKLTAGITFGGNSGAGGGVLQGVLSVVTEAAKAASDGGALANVNNWGGGGVKLHVLDAVFEGGGVLANGLDIRQCDGLVLERCEASGYTANSYRLSDNNVNSAAVIAAIQDIYGVGGTEYNNGTQGCALWIGHKCLVLARLNLSAGATSPLWTGNAFADTVGSDIVVAGANVGFYHEHFTRGCTFERFEVTVPNGGIGVNCEWDDGVAGNAASHDCVWRGGVLTGGKAGFDFDEGTESPTVDYCVFIGQTEAAIVSFKGTGTPTFGPHNDYSKLATGAVEVSYNHV